MNAMKLSFGYLLRAFALFAFCVPSLSANASEAACRQPATFDVRVIPVHGEIKYDLTKSLQEIQRSAGPVIAARHRPLLGMAVQGFGVVSVVQTSSIPRGYDQHCPILDGIELRIGWVDRTIFIAKEAMTVECLYREALEHQLRHVRLEDEALDAFLPGFAQELRTAVARVTSEPHSDAALAKRQLTESVDAVARSLVASLDKERSWRREIVESDEELERVRRACGDIDQRLREMGKTL